MHSYAKKQLQLPKLQDWLEDDKNKKQLEEEGHQGDNTDKQDGDIAHNLGVVHQVVVKDNDDSRQAVVKDDVDDNNLVVVVVEDDNNLVVVVVEDYDDIQYYYHGGIVHNFDVDDVVELPSFVDSPLQGTGVGEKMQQFVIRGRIFGRGVQPFVGTLHRLFQH